MLELNNIIDVHTHIHLKKFETGESHWLLDQYGHKDYSIEPLLERRSILMGFPISPGVDIERANNHVLELSLTYPNLIPFAIVDSKPDYWAGRGAKGFKEHSYGQRNLNFGSQRADKFLSAYDFAQKNDLPLILHAGRDRVLRVREMLLNFPNLRINLAHLGADFEPENNYKPKLEQVISTLEGLKDTSVMFDLSAVKDSKILKAALQVVGSMRIMFGSDYPDAMPLETLHLVEELNLSDSDLENILYKNAEVFLGC